MPACRFRVSGLSSKKKLRVHRPKAEVPNIDKSRTTLILSKLGFRAKLHRPIQR